MKQIILAVAAMMFAGSAMATGYGIIGGVSIKPDGQAPIVIQFDGTELFLSEADCEVQRQAYVVSTVKSAGSDLNGVFKQYSQWNPKQATKVDATKCIKVTPF